MQTIDVNACGPLRVVQQFLPLLQDGHVKLIVNMSSEAGSIQDCERTVWYGCCMSEVALNMQSRILASYLAPQGFRVVAVHPGGMKTDMLPSCTRSPGEAAESIYALVDKPGYSDRGAVRAVRRNRPAFLNLTGCRTSCSIEPRKLDC